MTVTLKQFHAEWCGPCSTQEPIIDELEEEYTSVNFERIDVDEQQDVANQYQVRSIPAIIIEQDGDVVKRFTGVTQRNDIESVFADTTV